MSDRLWRRAGRADIPALRSFLQSREETCTGFTGRLLRDGRLHLPSALRGGVWLADDGAAAEGMPGLAGAVLCHPSRLVIPLMPSAESGDERAADLDLPRALAGLPWTAASAIGPSRDIDRFETVCGLESLVRVQYRLMSLPGPSSAPLSPDSSPPGRDQAPAGLAGLRIRPALPGDLDALFPLQEAYEHEEVLTFLHRFDAPACRAALARSIREQFLFVAELGGRAVGKAGTNSRGIGTDQIGGVFTVPEFRGRGIASALMRALLDAIAAAGKKAVLFVKPDNPPAFGLYRRLGFEELCDYRADYFGT